MHVFFLVSAAVGVGVSTPDLFAVVPPQQPPTIVRPLGLPWESILDGWMPTYPAQLWPRHPLPRAIFEGTVFAAAVERAISPIVWLPHMPDWLPWRTLPTALHPFSSLSPIGELLAIAARGAWRPQLPLPLARTPWTLAAGATYTIPPQVPAAAQRCVDLIDSGYSTPSLADEIVERPVLLDEAVSSSTFIDEELC